MNAFYLDMLKNKAYFKDIGQKKKKRVVGLMIVKMYKCNIIHVIKATEITGENLTIITSINVKKAINFTETKEMLRLVSS